MSIFTAIGDFITEKITAPIVLGIGKALGAKNVPTAKEATEKFKSTTAGKVINTALSAAVVVAGGIAGKAALSAAPAGTAAKVGSVAKSLIPATTKGKVLAVGAAALAVPAVVANPKILSTAAKTVTDIPSLGYDIGEFSAAPTLKGAEKIITAHPELAVITGVALTAIVGSAGASMISSYLTRKEMKKQTAAMEKAAENYSVNPQAATPAAAAAVLPTTSPVSNQPAVPYEKAWSGSIGEQIPRETTQISTGTKKRRYKKAKAEKSPSVRQNVQVIVSNKALGSQTRKYINNAIYA